MADLVGFIGGGQMATALAAGAVNAGVMTEAHLLFADPSTSQQAVLKSNFTGSRIVADAADVLANCQKIVLAVKPHILKRIAPELASQIRKEHLLVSIAAGISLSSLQEMLETQRVIRVMPNTPCQVRSGASAIAADDNALAADVDWVETLMSSVGISERVPDESIHAVTGISGSSPAYVYLAIEALSDGGVAMGLPRETATRLAAQSVMGAAKMVLETGLHPGELKDRVTSPGGTTIAAIRQLEQAGTRSAFIEAVISAAERSKELG